MQVKSKPVSQNSESELIQHADGRVELRDYTVSNSSPLYNEDLAPVPVEKRTWTTYNYAALWISSDTHYPDALAYQHCRSCEDLDYKAVNGHFLKSGTCVAM